MAVEVNAPVSVDVRTEIPALDVDVVEAEASVDLVIRTEMPPFFEIEVG